MRILIIEDSDTIRRMLEALLSARDDEVVAVGSAVEGLDNAYRFVPDVVVLDLNLPGAYDGFEVCARLRADPATRETPIVVVSSRADEESRRRERLLHEALQPDRAPEGARHAEGPPLLEDAGGR